MDIYKAAIIAGGKGTRARTLTEDVIPKALIPIAGIPIIGRQLQLLTRYGIKKVAVMAGHLAKQLESSVQREARRLNLEIYFFVEDKPLGTAGGFHAAYNFFSDEDFLVFYGDVAVEMDLGRLAEFHRQKKAMVTIVAHPNNHPHESDLLRVDNNDRILEILPRKSRPPGFYRNLVPAAVYCFHHKVFDYIKPFKKQDFIKDVFPLMINNDRTVFAYNTPEYIRDLGTRKGYIAVENDIKKSLFFTKNISYKRPTIFFDRDGVLNNEIGGHGIKHPDDIVPLPMAAEAVRLVNEKGWLSVITTNQPQVAKGFISLRELDAVHGKIETLLGYEGAKLDRIYFCPHHPESGFKGEVPQFKIDCDCRKPKAGMLLRAMHELPVSREKSCMIGDSWRDMGAARAAGIFAYGVRTGVGCINCIGHYRPDLIFSDVLEAVTFSLFGVSETGTLADKITKILNSKKVIVIGISGIPRAGKSTFAHSLMKRFKSRKIKALHLRLDDWILPRSQRQKNSKVQDRLRPYLYPELLRTLLSGQKMTAPGYDPVQREYTEPITYQLREERIIILDGVLSCSDPIRNQLDYAVFLEQEKTVIMKRYKEFYTWKGENEHSVDQLLDSRMREEWPTVLRQRNIVDETVMLTGQENKNDHFNGAF